MMSELLDDQKMWDRLVDGELSPRERVALIEAVERQGEAGWRRCAVAFLEAQSWSIQMTQAIAALDGPQPTVSRAPASCERPRGDDARRSGRAVPRTLAMAAGLLLAFVTGTWWPQSDDALPPIARQQPPSEPLSAPAPAPLSPDPDARSPEQLAADRSRDALTLVVRGSDGGVQRLDLPLVEADRFAPRLADDVAGAPWQPLRERLQEHGLSLNTRRRYVPLLIQHDSGALESMVLPVDDAYVTPVNQTIF
jgi:hypothetical protein